MPQNAIIRANGTGDYTTLDAWEAAEQGSDYGSITIGRVDGFFDLGSGFLGISGAWINGAQLEPFDSADGFDGTERQLCGLTSTNNFRAIRGQTAGIILNGLEIYLTSTGGGRTVQGDAVGNIVANDCFISSTSDRVLQTVEVNNCVLTVSTRTSSSMTGTISLNNSTIFTDTSSNIGGAATLTANDSVSVNIGTGDDWGAVVTQSNNASTDTTADALDNIVVANEFVSATPVASGDYRILSTGDLASNVIGAFIQSGGGDGANCTITVDTGKMLSSQSDFVWMFTEDNLPAAAMDGSISSILNGGGNLRCYTDNTKTTQLPIEVIRFVTGVTPSVHVWGKSPTLNVAGTVYIEADTVETSQPVVTDTFGRNAVWSDFEFIVHQGTIIDSTGNHTPALSGTPSLVSSKWGGQAYNFSGTEGVVIPHTSSLNLSGTMFLSVWGDYSGTLSAEAFAIDKVDNLANGAYRLLKRTTGAWRFRTPGLSPSNTDTPVVDSSEEYICARTNGSKDIFRDGASLVSTALTGTYVGSTVDLVIGNQVDVTATPFSGWLGEAWGGAIAPSDDYINGMHTNQNDITFWTTSAWNVPGGVSGTITQATNSFTQSLVGTVVSPSFTGDITQTAQSFTQAAIGTSLLNISGTITQSTNAFTQALSGTVVTNITGVIEQTLSSFTQSLLGSVVENTTGTIEQTLSSFTQSLLGSVLIPVTGNINQTASSFTQSALGSISISWVDKLPVSTAWENQAETVTTWTDQSGVSTIWTDKV